MIGELVVAPAKADRPHKRSGGSKGSNELHKAHSAQKQFQHPQSAQKQVQQLQQIEAAQKQIQALQQIEAAQKKIQALQQLQATLKHAKKVHASHHDKHPPGAQSLGNSSAGKHKQKADANHQSEPQNTIAKYWDHHPSPGQNALTSKAIQYPSPKLGGHGGVSKKGFKHDDGPSHAGVKGHGYQSALQNALDKFKWTKASWAGKGTKASGAGKGKDKDKDKAKTKEGTGTEQVAETPKSESQSQNNKGGGTNIGIEAPDIKNVVSLNTTKLPDVASSATTRTDSTPDDAMRLGGPQPPPSGDKDSGKSKTKIDDNGTDDGSGGAKQAGRGLGRRVAGELQQTPGTFKLNEVLAIDFNAAGAAKAKHHKFKVLDTIHYPALGFSVTRLETPDVLNAVIGRSALQEELPTDGFGLNHIYTVDRMRPATAPNGTDGASGTLKSAAVPVPAAPSTNVGRPGFGCAPDRCFGVGVINWQPKLAACAQGVRIGVIDTGVDKSHPAFAGVRFRHKDLTPPDTKKPGNQHGTGIFSLLAGNPRSGTPGLVPDASFLVGDAFFADRNGNAMSDTVTMLKAINWLIESGVDIANLSFAGPPDELVHDSIRKLARKGTVILAAAGNEGRDAPKSYPAAYPEVIAVTAVDRNLAAYAYAGRGDHIDVAAPGVEIWTALPNRREGPQTGTSFAVPFVTSIVALSYRSEDQNTGPLEPKKRALALLQKNIKAIGDRGRNPVFGVGLVQAPSNCVPHESGAVATAGPRPQPALPAPSLQPAGSWESTVHPVANRK